MTIESKKIQLTCEQLSRIKQSNNRFHVMGVYHEISKKSLLYGASLLFFADTVQLISAK